MPVITRSARKNAPRMNNEASDSVNGPEQATGDALWDDLMRRQYFREASADKQREWYEERKKEERERQKEERDQERRKEEREEERRRREKIKEGEKRELTN